MEKKWFLINRWNSSGGLGRWEKDVKFINENDLLEKFSSDKFFTEDFTCGVIFLYELTNEGQQLERKDLLNKIFETAQSKV